MREIDRDKTLTELEGDDWGKPSFPSGLVVTCHRLRKKPLREFTIEDLRIMLAQNISAEILMPIAIEVLDNEPLAEGDFFPGDLLASCLTACEKGASSSKELKQIARRAAAMLAKTDDYGAEDLVVQIESFLSARS